MSFVTKPPTGFISRQRDWFYEEAQKILRQKSDLKYLKKVDVMKKFGREKKDLIKDYEVTLDYFFGKVQSLDHELNLLNENINLRKRPISSRELNIQKVENYHEQNEQPRKIYRKNQQNGNFEEIDFPLTQPNTPQIPDL
jgi:hypothetical protein